MLSEKRSPKKPGAATIFEGLVSFPTLLSHPNLTIEVLLCREDHIRKPAPVRGRRYLRDPGERRLIEVLSRIELSSRRRRGAPDPLVRRPVHHARARQGHARPAPAGPEDGRLPARARGARAGRHARARAPVRVHLNWRPECDTSCQKAPTPRACASRSASTSTSAPGTRGRSRRRTTTPSTAGCYSDGLTLRHADGRLTLIDRATGETFAGGGGGGARRGCSTATFRVTLREPLEDVIEMRALRARGARAQPRARAGRAQPRREDRRAPAPRDPHQRPDAAARAHLGHGRARVRPRPRARPGGAARHAEPARGDRPARRRGRRGPRRRPGGRERQARPRPRARRAGERRRRDRLRPAARDRSPTTCPGRSRTSTPSSCTTCASPSAARARCSASSSRSTPSGWSTSARSSSASRASPATCATSTCTCSTSRTCAPPCRWRCARTSTRCSP